MKPLILPACLASLVSAAWATDIPVSAGQSIQAAIQSASPGDRLLVAPGTYLGGIDLLGKAIEIQGVGGPGVTIIDAELAGRAVTMLNAEGPQTILRGLTITRGSMPYTAGGVVTNGTPTLIDCVIRQNYGRAGAGVSGSPTMTDCIIEDNVSSLNHGGGVYGHPTMTRCTIRRNRCTSADGGGLYVIGGNAVFTDCVIEGNSAVLAYSKAGGAFVHSTSTALFDHCIIAGNSAGGGNNGAYAGGIWGHAGVTLRHCTLSGNLLGVGAPHGAAVYGAAVLEDCIVFGNETPQLEGVGSVSYSLVEGGWAGAGNIDSDPLFWDMANGDYHLMAGSPCIDTGNPAGTPDPDGSLPDMGALPYDSTYTGGPVTYCLAEPNSTGMAAVMGWSGSVSVASNDLTLHTAGCPAGQFGIYLMGGSQAYLPVAQGYLCVGAPLYRMDIVQTDGSGAVSVAVDNQAPALGAPAIAGGDIWNFQLWYRDFGGNANFSDGLMVTFEP
ncbi:MAG: right-handed parallel beta-helix repeat-containing protein [Planctomycetota bacterium]